MQGEYGEKIAESRGKECELITRVNYTQRKCDKGERKAGKRCKE